MREAVPSWPPIDSIGLPGAASRAPSRDSARPAGRPSVLISCDHYLPGVRAGGPIRSVGALVAAFGREFDLRIVTRDRDLGEDRPYADVPAGSWVERDGARVLYWPGGRPGLVDWRRIAADVRPDVVYVNSFFSPRFSLAPLVLHRLGRFGRRCRFVLAPRGELHPGALAIRRPKKVSFLRLARRLDLARGVVWHATAREEADHVRAWFGENAHVATAPVLARRAGVQTLRDGAVRDGLGPVERVPGGAASTAGCRPPKRRGELDLAFLSRVSPKKNLVGAIEMLRGVEGSVRLHVYGPKEDAAYWRLCQRTAESLPANVRVSDGGTVEPEAVTRVLERHHAFFLPTHGENFGHVILESLLAGVPVLISDQTPWRGLADRRAGWDLPLAQPEAFRERLAALVEMNEAELATWSSGARRLGAAYANDEGALHSSREMLLGAEALLDTEPLLSTEILPMRDVLRGLEAS